MNFNLICDRSKEALELLYKNSYYTNNIINCVMLLKKLNINDFILEFHDERVVYENGILIEYSNDLLNYSNKKIVVNKDIKNGNYEIQEFLRRKELLDKANTIEIIGMDKLIVGTYKFFFRKNPNFKDSVTRDQIQILAYFLSFVLSPIKYSTYFTRFSDNLPYNEFINYEMDKLQVLDNKELSSLDIDEKIDKGIRTLINKLGKEFKKATLCDIVNMHHDYYQSIDPTEESIKLNKCINASD